MKEIDSNTPIWQLTVGQFMELQNRSSAEKKYEYGLKGIARIFGCSMPQANRIKSSGIIDDAIVQNGKIIVIDKEKALQLFGKK
ncbi:DUF3853 family protein [Elizabethkingia miricola]|uniref:DUF3853 family protein n=1 Tax=Elizabethkingia miricola TaxID=172045 RepID=UPI000C145201|nr:DUF3853 family protein [Elizabethkingia miricola]NHQ68821.1 DUF3853 family protein [Elizabethkingia miricola]NHQ72579.1 DUF3853 family protein [Elizabethkingia miricola]NHQ79359.1 DUF3853 family protein [Elizabethkingia miricola]PSL88973.1 DUF3853 domain-containing protein [Elizabethkingia miricola]QHQ85794.1 DUF3853 family protein [Elizabethkingia miricola]